jgi:steroid delta-isomerase
MSDQITAKAVLQAYIDGFNDADADALSALFASDAVIEDPVGTPLKRGADIPAWFRQGVAMGARLELVAPIRGSHGRAAAMAFKVHMVQDGQPLTIRSLDTIEINEQGLITRLDGYWGVDDIEPGQRSG